MQAPESTRLKRRLAVVLVAIGCLLAAGSAPRLSPPDNGVLLSGDDIPLPFTSPADNRAADQKLVFAHYFPPYPISIDNQAPTSDYYTRSYLSPDGEGGKHAAYGGLLRDRPLPGYSRSSPDWELENMRTEVRRAIGGGLDGFTVDLLTLGTRLNDDYWRRTNKLLQAASEVAPNFKIVLMPDTNGQPGDVTPVQLADATAKLAQFKSAYRLQDGRLVVMPYNPEKKGAAYWRDYVSAMRARSLAVALVPTFVANPSSFIDEYAPFSYGISHWGGRNPAYNDPTRTDSGSARDLSARLHRMGLKWVQPISIQDARPYAGVFDEALNTRNLINTWATARETNADWSHIATWNDYSEGTHLSPSQYNGFGYLQANAYYASWFKTGVAPNLNAGLVLLTHRTQPVVAQYGYPETKLMRVRTMLPGLGTTPVNQAEALIFSPIAGRATIRSGAGVRTIDIAPGVSSITTGLSAGQVSVRITTQQGRPIAGIVSPWMVTSMPYTQDMQYRAVAAVFPTSLSPLTSANSPAPAVNQTIAPSVTPTRTQTRKKALRGRQT